MKIKELLYVSKVINSGVKHGSFYKFVKFAAVCSVLLGTMALLISMSVLQGFEDKLAENAIKFTSHIKLEQYRQAPITNYSELISRLKLQFPQIATASPFTQKEALISSKADVDGIMLKAIDVQTEATNIKSKIISGKMPELSSNQIIIGERLAKKLNVQIGNKVTVYLMLNSAGNSQNSFPEIEKFEISGIYRTGMAKYDDISVFCELHYLSQLLKYEANQCGGIDIMIKPGKDIIASSKSIEAYLDFPYFCTNVYELHGAMFAWIELQKKPIPLVLGLISLVAVMNIITILLILIVEKTHTIGILRTLGMSPKAILTVFLVRGTAIGAIGTALGGIAAFGITYLQQTYEIIKLKGEIYFLDALPITIELNNYLLVLGLSLAFSFIVTLLPALTALKIKPIKAINFR